jgi:hypothetical protein
MKTTSFVLPYTPHVPLIRSSAFVLQRREVLLQKVQPFSP